MAFEPAPALYLTVKSLFDWVRVRGKPVALVRGRGWGRGKVNSAPHPPRLF